MKLEMKKIFDPTLVKRNLIIASLIITTFEILRSVIQDRIKGFFCFNYYLNDAGELEYEISEEYKNQILDRAIPEIRSRGDYHLFYSSCLWLKDNEVITQENIDDIQKIRKHRNLIAHEPVKLLVDEQININIYLLKKSIELISKIDKWWILEFEVTINPDFDGIDINPDNVKSGYIVFLDHLTEIVKEEMDRAD